MALKKSKNVLVLWLFDILNIVHLQRLKGMKRRSKLGICQWKRYKKGYLRYQKWYIAGVRGCTLPVWDLNFVENPAPPDFPLIVASAFSRHQRIRPSARKKTACGTQSSGGSAGLPSGRNATSLKQGRDDDGLKHVQTKRLTKMYHGVYSLRNFVTCKTPILE